MSLWYRVFCRSGVPVKPAALLECLLNLDVAATGWSDRPGDAWTQAELDYGAAEPLQLERFLAGEEGIRAELNTWAAFLETCEYSPNNVPLMEHMIQTQQLFTLRRPLDVADEGLAVHLCVALAQELAAATDGVYQVDGEGFYSPDGVLLVPENA